MSDLNTMNQELKKHLYVQKDVPKLGVKFTGNCTVVNEFFGEEVIQDYETPNTALCPKCGQVFPVHGFIPNEVGGVIACPGDMIMREGVGDFYPVRPKVFKEKFKPYFEG